MSASPRGADCPRAAHRICGLAACESSNQSSRLWLAWASGLLETRAKLCDARHDPVAGDLERLSVRLRDLVGNLLRMVDRRIERLARHFALLGENLLRIAARLEIPRHVESLAKGGFDHLLLFRRQGFDPVRRNQGRLR